MPELQHLQRQRRSHVAEDIEEAVLDEIAGDTEEGQSREEGRDGVDGLGLEAVVVVGDCEAF